MNNSKYLIIGDGVAGNSAAETIKRNDEDTSITVLTADSEPLYNRITLKSYMKGKMPKKFTRVHQRDWYQEKDIDLELETTVIDVDKEEKQVKCADGSKYSYEKLLLATGGKKKHLPEDEGFDNLHYMWDWQDADTIKESAEEADKAVVIGAGLLGIDLAVIYAEHGVEVDYLMRGSHWWRRGISQEGAEIVHQKLEEKGVNIVKNCPVDEIIHENGEARKVIGENGEAYICDAVGVAIGRDPNFGYVDVEKTDTGAVKTDRFLETSEEDIYAAGDLVNYYSPLFEHRREGGTWDHSARMGRRAGENIAGEKEEFYFVPSYGVGHFDVQLLSLGENHGEKIWRRDGDQYLEIAFEDDRVIGAVLIGDMSPSDGIEEAIEDKKSFEDKEAAIESFW